MKKNILNILVLVLAGTMILGMTACSKRDSASTNSGGSSSITSTDTSVSEQAKPTETTDIPEVTAAPEITGMPEDNASEFVLPDSIEIGEAFPNFSVELADGSVFTLSEALKTKKAVLINLWGTWCGPCRNEIPFMNEAYDMFSDSIAVVCLSDADSNEDIAAFMSENNITLPMGYDSIGLSSILIREGYPTNIIVDRFGNYAFYECGSVPDVDSFVRLFEYYIGDTYTKTTVLERLPGPKSDVAALPDEELTEALCKDGSLTFTTPTDEVSVWPFIKTENGIINSNSEVYDCYAVCSTTVEAKKDDVFTFKYNISADSYNNGLFVKINGNKVRYISGEEEGTYSYQFKEDGTYRIDLKYLSDDFEDYYGNYSNTVQLYDASLATGEEARMLAKDIVSFPKVLSGTEYEITVLNSGAKELMICDPEGNPLTFENYSFYIVPAETVKIHISIGDEVDPYSALCEDYAGEFIFSLAELETDETGFIYEETVLTKETGNIENSCFEMDVDCFGDDFHVVYVFADEENANFFFYEDDEVIYYIWKYADGTMPETQGYTVSSEEENNNTPATYTINIVDKDGNPIDGCMVNVCTDELCNPGVAKDGVYTFTDIPYPYIIHVLKAPEGYTFDSGKEYIMPEEGGEITIILE